MNRRRTLVFIFLIALIAIVALNTQLDHVSVLVSHRMCDLDQDEDCDGDDRALALRALGSCVNQDGFYIEPVDYDHDDCVTVKDVKVFEGYMEAGE